MKTFIFSFIFLHSLKLFAQDFELKTGDLLFQDLDCGELCVAIEKVTSGYQQMNFSHVGIIFIQDGNIMVIEALNGVAIISLSEFLDRIKDENGNPKVVVGRINKEFKKREGINYKSAIKKAQEFLGAPYDDEFKLDNGKFYCSELIYETYLDRSGNHIFSTAPMTFKDPETQQTFPEWERYFKENRLPIPEGKPGLNPGGMSKAPFLEIIYEYGNISKKL